MFYNVSIIICAVIALLIPQVEAWGHRTDPDMPKDPRILKAMRQDRLKEKLKMKGDLPYEQWYEAGAYYEYQG